VVAQYIESGAVVAGGLKAGETIVVAGVHKLNPGDVIKPVPVATPVAANPSAASAPATAPGK
jgi:xanthine/uracil/vitamin C permease (AzgA family)